MCEMCLGGCSVNRHIQLKRATHDVRGSLFHYAYTLVTLLVSTVAPRAAQLSSDGTSSCDR